MTEDEAKKKICHIMSHARNDFISCQGSNCMAWQPYETAAFKKKADLEFQRTGNALRTSTGYCKAGANPKTEQLP